MNVNRFVIMAGDIGYLNFTRSFYGVNYSLLKFLIFLFFGIERKRAVVSPDGKRLYLPIDTQNTRGVTGTLPAFGVWGGVWWEGWR